MKNFGSKVDLSGLNRPIILSPSGCWPCDKNLQVELITISDIRIVPMWHYLIELEKVPIGHIVMR